MIKAFHTLLASIQRKSVYTNKAIIRVRVIFRAILYLSSSYAEVLYEEVAFVAFKAIKSGVFNTIGDIVLCAIFHSLNGKAYRRGKERISGVQKFTFSTLITLKLSHLTGFIVPLQTIEFLGNLKTN